MIITSSNLGMDASTVYREVNTEKKMMMQGGNADSSGGFIFNPERSGAVSSSNMVSQIAGTERSGISSLTSVSEEDHTGSKTISGEQFASQMISEIFGQKVNLREFKYDSQEDRLWSTGQRRGMGAHGLSLPGAQLTLGLDLFEYQYEKLEVNTSGTLRTSDGRDIKLQLNLTLEREEVIQQSGIRMLPSRFIDPLVLSFQNGLNVLGNSSFCFDLNCDGTGETINSLKPGSGYLVLDRNHDGVVNSGLELFGPESGYGYDELRLFDHDGNNWIDENDPVFEKLQLWMGAGNEAAELISLKEAGVGALSLASADAHFNLKDSSGGVIGQIAQSGIFVTEKGEVFPLTEVKLGATDSDNRLYQSFSNELRVALVELRQLISQHRRRVKNMEALELRREETNKPQDWLLQRLFQIRDVKRDILG